MCQTEKQRTICSCIHSALKQSEPIKSNRKNKTKLIKEQEKVYVFCLILNNVFVGAYQMQSSRVSQQQKVEELKGKFLSSFIFVFLFFYSFLINKSETYP